jgi:hypothetical protein
VSPFGEHLRVVWAQTSSISDVAFIREALQALATSYDVVLVDCGQRGLRSEAWWSRVLSCNAVATVATVRRTRISAVRRLVRNLEEDIPHLGVIMLRGTRSLAARRSRVPVRALSRGGVAEPAPAAG